MIQVKLDQRPVSIDPVTKMMYPDGIFVRSLNAGQALMRVKVPYYGPPNVLNLVIFEGAEANGISIQDTEGWRIVPSDWTHFYKLFQLDISNLNVGKHSVTIRLRYRRFLPGTTVVGDETVEYQGVILVLDAEFDSSTYSGTARVPEGEYFMQIKGVHIFQERKIKGRVPCDNKAIFLPNDFITRITYDTPFSGTHGPIPFNDPWWKAVGLVVGILAGAVAGVWLVGGWLGFWDSPIEHTESGSVDPETGETCRECQPAPAGQGYTSVQGDPVWGAFVTASILGFGTFAADIIDPYRRGEIASPPDAGDKTLSEDLGITLKFEEFPLAGTPYKIGGQWVFQRHGESTADYPAVTQQDEVQNIHYLRQYSVRTSDGGNEYPRATTDEIGVEVDLRHLADYARFQRETAEGLRKAMPEFYVFGYLRHRQSGAIKSAVFTPQDGLHVGAFSVLDTDPLGYWDLMAIIQNVNNADPTDSPTEQAQHIGGFIYSKNFGFQHDPSSGTCIVSPDWDLTINLV